MQKEDIKIFCAPEISDHAGLVNLKFLSRGVLKLSKMCMLLVKPCHIVLFYLTTGNILSSYQFYSGTKIIVRPSRS